MLLGELYKILKDNKDLYIKNSKGNAIACNYSVGFDGFNKLALYLSVSKSNLFTDVKCSDILVLLDNVLSSDLLKSVFSLNDDTQVYLTDTNGKKMVIDELVVDGNCVIVNCFKSDATLSIGSISNTNWGIDLKTENNELYFTVNDYSKDGKEITICMDKSDVKGLINGLSNFLNRY